MTERQKRFADEYLLDMNATAAAKRAGYSEGGAAATGRALLEREDVKALIDAKRADIATRLGISRERILFEYAAIAFARLTDYMTVSAVCGEDGEVVYDLHYKDTDSLSDAQKIAISAIKKGDRGGVVISTHDKFKALECLCRFLGMNEQPQKDDRLTVVIKGGDDGYAD